MLLGFDAVVVTRPIDARVFVLVGASKTIHTRFRMKLVSTGRNHVLRNYGVVCREFVLFSFYYCRLPSGSLPGPPTR